MAKGSTHVRLSQGYDPAYFATKVVGTLNSGTTCREVDGCNPDTLDDSIIYDYVYASSTDCPGSFTGGCPRITSCSQDAGWYPDLSLLGGCTDYEARPHKWYATCYKCMDSCGSPNLYSTSPNTSFFSVTKISETASCYRADGCHTAAGAYASSPNIYFFDVVSSHGTGIECFRATGCNSSHKAYTTKPANDSFFVVSSSQASGHKCYRADGCNTSGGAYTSKPNTTYFYVGSSQYLGSTCYRATNCNPAKTITTPSSVADLFAYSTSSASGLTCYMPTGCNTAAGASTTQPNTNIFNYKHSGHAGVSCYRATSCKEGYTSTNNGTTLYQHGNIKCYKEQSTTDCPTYPQVCCWDTGLDEAKINGTQKMSGDTYCGYCVVEKDCNGNIVDLKQLYSCNIRYGSAIYPFNSSNPTSTNSESYNVCGWKVTKVQVGSYYTWSSDDQWIQQCCTTTGTSNPCELRGSDAGIQATNITSISNMINSNCSVAVSGSDYYVYLN